jgi:hypothetical protein
MPDWAAALVRQHAVALDADTAASRILDVINRHACTEEATL